MGRAYVILPEGGLDKPVGQYDAKTLAWDVAGRLRTLHAGLEDAHMGCSKQSKAWASDADQGIGQ